MIHRHFDSTEEQSRRRGVGVFGVLLARETANTEERLELVKRGTLYMNP